MPQSIGKLDRPAVVTFAGAGVFLCVILAMTALALLGSWRQYYQVSGEALDGKTALMGQSTARTFQAVETTLAILDDEVVAASSRGMGRMRRTLEEATARVLRFTPHVRQILLTDRTGALLFDTARTGGRPISLDDLGLEGAVDLDAGVAGLLIGRPAPGRFLDGIPAKSPPEGLWVIPAARPLSDGSGRLLIAVLSPGAILQSFAEALSIEDTVGGTTFAGLFGSDGQVLAALPRSDINSPWDVAPNRTLADLARNRAFGHQTMEVPFQGGRGWVAWWRDSRYPIVVAGGRTTARINSDWSRDENIVLMGAAVFVMIMVFTVLLFVPMVIQRLRMRVRIRVLEQAVEKGPASVIITDPRGGIEYVNESFTRMTGYTSRDAIGQTPAILRASGTPVEVFEDLWRTIRDGRAWRGEVLNRARDGRERWVDMAVTGVKDDMGEILHYVAVQVDINDRKAAENRTRHLLERLDQSNRDLEQFAYVASHDLQEPLRMVISYLGLSRRRLGPELNEETKTFMDFAETGAKRMRRMIEDLLQYSRAGAQDVEPDSVDLGEAIADAMAHLTVAIRDEEAQIAVPDALPRVMGHRDQVARLLMNLIGNAIKYRDPDRIPRIDVAARVEGAWCLLTVADNGVGIAEEDRERVLQPFQRGGAVGLTEGTGIGLAICKKIAERSGGTLTLTSEPGVGTTFTVTLPLVGARVNDAESDDR